VKPAAVKFPVKPLSAKPPAHRLPAAYDKRHNHTSDCSHAWRSKAFKILIYILLIYEDGLKYKGYHERRKSLIGEML